MMTVSALLSRVFRCQAPADAANRLTAGQKIGFRQSRAPRPYAAARRSAACVAALGLCCGAMTLGGCASGPSGGATITAPNRLQVTLTMARTLNPNYYYAIAFDDEPGDANGPVGIVGNTPILNGVVGGNWRVLVLWHLNSFEVYRRTDPADLATESRILASPFLGTPRASGNTLDFTLDLDAKLSDGSYFFTHTSDATPVLATERFDINAVTTNTVLRDPADNRLKPVDALGAQSTSTPVFDFQVGASRVSTISDVSGDITPDVDASFLSGPEAVTFNQMDLTDVRISITRG